MHIKLANPRGFCAGVDRAIEIVNRALEVFGPPIYVRHEVVHNKFVVEDLRNRGAIFVEELDQVPDDVIVIFSAHGVSQAVRQEAAGRGLKVFDATCPLVTKVHIEVARYSRDGKECILIGHAGHPEVEGTMGQYDASNGGAIYLVEDENDWYSRQLHAEDRYVVEALQALGLRVIRRDWADPANTSGDAQSLLFRSTWDYFDRFATFSPWLEQVSQQCQLFNPAPLLRWNVDKHYLAHLQTAGVRIVPTHFIEVGDPHGEFIVTKK